MDSYDRIDQILKQKGVSRRRAAQMAGIPPTTLNGALYRKTGLSFDAVCALADVLEVDANYLLHGKTLEERDAEYIDGKKKRVEEAKAGIVYLDGLSQEEVKAVNTIVQSMKKKNAPKE